VKFGVDESISVLQNAVLRVIQRGPENIETEGQAGELD
jgi:hypothetical protein